MEFFYMSWMMGLMFIIFIPLTILWIWSLVDCIISDMRTEEKLFWVIIIFLFNIIGSIFYVIFVHMMNREVVRKMPKRSSNKTKRLIRDRKDRMIAGVCGGIARYFNIDSTVVRLLFVLIVFVTGFVPALIFYIVAWMIVPER